MKKLYAQQSRQLKALKENNGSHPSDNVLCGEIIALNSSHRVADDVKFLDLTVPQYELPIFDWGISIDLADYIPANYDTVYIDNLVRHVRVGLILSWAVPGQDGHLHPNTKTVEEVSSRMSDKGFTRDIKAGEPLRNAATFFNAAGEESSGLL